MPRRETAPRKMIASSLSSQQSSLGWVTLTNSHLQEMRHLIFNISHSVGCVIVSSRVKYMWLCQYIPSCFEGLEQNNIRSRMSGNSQPRRYSKRMHAPFGALSELIMTFFSKFQLFVTENLICEEHRILELPLNINICEWNSAQGGFSIKRNN